jgi:hypothetical protein
MPAPVARAALVLTLLTAASSLAGCADEPPVVTTPRPEVVSPNAPSVSTALPERPDRGVPQLVNLAFEDGVATGATGEVPVKLNSLVRVSVIADVTDVVVVEGYGQTVQTAVDRAVQLEILADRAGSFPVRLRDGRTLLTTLVVR